MLVDFSGAHDAYLTAKPVDGKWLYRPFNPDSPATGGYLATHTVFSNNGLFVGIGVYNGIKNGACVSVKHSLVLTFSRKDGARYLLGNDSEKITIHIDLGVASGLYSLMLGLAGSFECRQVRYGKPPKLLNGTTRTSDGQRVIDLQVGVQAQGGGRIVVELGRAAQIAIAAFCVGYGRFLYPSLSDSTIRELLSEKQPVTRACADGALHPVVVPGGHGEPEPIAARACAGDRREPDEHSHRRDRYKKAIWAIGNNKWPSKDIAALQRIQAVDDLARLKLLIDQGNAGDFSAWDAFL